MIEINNIHLKTNRTLIKNGSLKLHSGTISAIIGKSGTGKTTLLYLVGLLHPLDKALNYHFHGVDLQYENLDDFRRNHIHFVFQDYALFEHLTLLENIQMMASMQSLSIDQQELNELLERMHLNLDLNKKVSEISGGQKQRLAILIAVLKHPELIILDEPTSSLDQSNVHDLMALLQEMVKRYGFSILLTTHSKSVLDYCDTIYQIENQQLTCVKEVIKEDKQIKLHQDPVPYSFYFKYLYYVIKNKWRTFLSLILINILGLIIFFSLPSYLNRYFNQQITSLNDQFNQEVFIVNGNQPYYNPANSNFSDEEISQINTCLDFQPYKEVWCDEVQVNGQLVAQNYIFQYHPFYKQGEVIVPTSSSIEVGSTFTFDDQSFVVTKLQEDLTKSHSLVTGTLVIIGSTNQDVSSAYIGKCSSLQELHTVLPKLQALNKALSYDYLTYNMYEMLLSQNQTYLMVLRGIVLGLLLIMNLLIQRRFIYNRSHELTYLRCNGLNQKQFYFLNSLERLCLILVTIFFVSLVQLFKVSISMLGLIGLSYILYSLRLFFIQRFLNKDLSFILRSEAK